VLDEQRMQRNKEWLLEERTRLQAEIRSVSAPMDERERPGLGTHMADNATEVFEQARNLAVGQRLRSTLEQVNRALDKMDKGTYRVCDQCGGPIDPARLKALPHATYCKSCQARLELAARPR
jgi:DnaK suppressor protein